MQSLISSSVVNDHWTACICIVHTELISWLLRARLTQNLVVVGWWLVAFSLDSSKSLYFAIIIVLLLLLVLSVYTCLPVWMARASETLFLALIYQLLIVVVTELPEERRIKKFFQLFIFPGGLRNLLVTIFLFPNDIRLLNICLLLVLELGSRPWSSVVKLVGSLNLASFLFSVGPLSRLGTFKNFNRNIVVRILIVIHHLGASHSNLVLYLWLDVPQIDWILLSHNFAWVVTSEVRVDFTFLLSVLICFLRMGRLRSLLYHYNLLLGSRLVFISLRVFLALLITRDGLLVQNLQIYNLISFPVGVL